eukprot:7591142-Lingulodinium_polyedra.AAC.1
MAPRATHYRARSIYRLRSLRAIGWTTYITAPGVADQQRCYARRRRALSLLLRRDIFGRFYTLTGQTLIPPRGRGH